MWQGRGVWPQGEPFEPEDQSNLETQRAEDDAARERRDPPGQRVHGVYSHASEARLRLIQIELTAPSGPRRLGPLGVYWPCRAAARRSVMARRRSSAPKMLEPATRIVAPARTSAPACTGPIPPSTSSSAWLPAASSSRRARATFGSI